MNQTKEKGVLTTCITLTSNPIKQQFCYVVVGYILHITRLWWATTLLDALQHVHQTTNPPSNAQHRLIAAAKEGGRLFVLQSILDGQHEAGCSSCLKQRLSNMHVQHSILYILQGFIHNRNTWVREFFFFVTEETNLLLHHHYYLVPREDSAPRSNWWCMRREGIDTKYSFSKNNI